MAGLLAGLHDERRPGHAARLLRRVRPLTDRRARAHRPAALRRGRRGSPPRQSRAAYGEEGFTTLERVWARPTCEVHGIWGGYTGPGHKTIVPTDAHAKVSFRLVADQDPAGGARRDATPTSRGARPAGHRARPSSGSATGSGPASPPLDDPALQATTRAMERAFGARGPLHPRGRQRTGGRPRRRAGCAVVFLGVGLPDDRIHAPNERVVFPLLLTGAAAAAYLWEELPRLRSPGAGDGPRAVADRRWTAPRSNGGATRGGSTTRGRAAGCSSSTPTGAPWPTTAGSSSSTRRVDGAAAGTERVLPRDRRRTASPTGPSSGALPRRLGARPVTLRDVGATLSDLDAGLIVHGDGARQLARDPPALPPLRGGHRPADAGWVRRCPADGSDHFPRTDPAVIVLVHDGGDGCLLGRQPTWPRGRYSTLAGFVEPGESLEQAVAREVAEESGRHRHRHRLRRQPALAVPGVPHARLRGAGRRG